MPNPPIPWSGQPLRNVLLALVIPSLGISQDSRDTQELQGAVAIEAGSVHPVSGPVIQNGVVLIRGERIASVGRQGEVEIPAGATVLSYPEAHVYPGLVDALSLAFADASVADDRGADAGTPIYQGLDRHQTASQKLVSYGITTAYVGNRSAIPWRGIGAVLRLQGEGFEIFPDRGEAAVQMRLTSGPGRSHPLARQKTLAAAGDAFKALDAYKKRFADHETALAEYKQKYEEYLAYHREKEGASDDSAAAQRGSNRGRRGGRGRRGARRGPAGQGRGQRGEGQGQGERGSGADAEQTVEPAEGETEEEEAEEVPTKPEYPKAPAREPDKEALLKVLGGERTLRVEVQRREEVQTALRLALDYDIPRMVLEHAAGAGPIAADLARQGVPVVITQILPGSTPQAYGGGDSGRLPARLAASGVAVAIASGTVGDARHLPLVAAYAVGKGLDPETALRAITLTPAEILRVSREVGSLETGKLADIVVYSGPIFASDSRVLRVLSAGTTQYEAR